MTRFVVIGVLSAVLLTGAAPVMALDGSQPFRGVVEAWFAKVWDGFGAIFGESASRAKGDDSTEMVVPRDDDDSDGTIGDVIIPRK